MQVEPLPEPLSNPTQPSDSTVRVALGVSYNGHAYNGWQSQLSGNTIQDKL